MYHTLISVTELHQQLHDANLVVIDSRYDLANSNAGQAAFNASHIPGALYAHLDQDMSGIKTPTTGRHPLPNPKAFMAIAGRWGIDASKQVVVYDADNGAMAAARLWWLLRWLGHTKVAVLDGGFNHWQAAGFETSHSLFTPAHRQFTGTAQASWVCDATEVAAHATQTDWRVLDARAPERYAGVTEPIDAVAGHVPGAINYPLTRNLQSDGRFKPAATLRAAFLETLDSVSTGSVNAGAVSGSHVIAMCGSGVTACHSLLALEVAGIHGARLYAGSWSEWITDPSRPVARGPQP